MLWNLAYSVSIPHFRHAISGILEMTDEVFIDFCMNSSVYMADQRGKVVSLRSTEEKLFGGTF